MNESTTKHSQNINKTVSGPSGSLEYYTQHFPPQSTLQRHTKDKTRSQTQTQLNPSQIRKKKGIEAFTHTLAHTFNYHSISLREPAAPSRSLSRLRHEAHVQVQLTTHHTSLPSYMNARSRQGTVYKRDVTQEVGGA